MSQTTNQATSERNSILSEKPIFHTSDLREWKMRLDQTEEARSIMGLLHYGLNKDMSGLPYEDILCLYLEYAYGYNSLTSFIGPGEMIGEPNIQFDYGGRIVCSSVQGIKQMIAKKAFSVLCDHFLKDTREGNSFKQAPEQLSWWSLAVQKQKLLDEIIHFFSSPQNIPSRLHSNHAENIAIDFLYKLSTSAWKIGFSDARGRKMEIPEILIKNRKHFIEILWHLDELDFLNENWELLSPADVNTIKFLASNVRGYNELIMSPEEALQSGSNMAECYFLVQKKLEVNSSSF